MIPGGSSACVQVFDATANKINTWWFKTGWRISLYDASIEYSAALASDLILLHTAPDVNGRNVVKEYYALSNDRLRFIRMENDKGELVQNEYAFSNYEIGFSPDANNADQWITLLESKDKADVLSALVFLGGRHIDDEWFRDLTGNARISALVARLADSDNEWIRQAAVLAARGPRERFLQ
jgi:hypothetical protein